VVRQVSLLANPEASESANEFRLLGYCGGNGAVQLRARSYAAAPALLLMGLELIPTRLRPEALAVSIVFIPVAALAGYPQLAHGEFKNNRTRA